jgi:hypothetical protein
MLLRDATDDKKKLGVLKGAFFLAYASIWRGTGVKLVTITLQKA